MDTQPTPADHLAAIAETLTRAEHAHAAWAIYQDGADDDWATFYAAFLVDQSPLPSLLDLPVPVPLTRARVTAALVGLADDYAAAQPDQPWQHWYSARLVQRLTPARP